MGILWVSWRPADKHLRVVQLLAFEDLDVSLDVLQAYAASGVRPTYPEHIVPCYCAAPYDCAAPSLQKVADCASLLPAARGPFCPSSSTISYQQGAKAGSILC